jgi:hypothetical protein
MYKLEGKIINVTEVQHFGDNGFCKRVVTVQTEQQYDNTIPVEFVKNDAENFNGSVGDSITINFSLAGREHNDKYFVNLRCGTYSIEGAPVAEEAPVEEDDLPF